MRLSRRINAITEDGSDGWEILYRSRAMIADGHDIVELTIGEHDHKTNPLIMDALEASLRGGNTGYAAVPGSRGLREAVAERVEASTGVPTSSKNVIVTTGGQAALFAAHLALLDEGEVGLYTDPYYATYPGGIRSLGARAVPVPTASEHGFLPQRDVLEPLAKDARSLLINSPNNPTGAVYPMETMQMIVDVCQQNEVGLISDEVYDTMVWDGEHISPRALPGMADNCFVIGSMSKSHAMTGWRVGWVIGPEEAIERILDLSTINTYGVPGFIQDAAEYALREGTDIEVEVAEVFRRRMARVQAVLAGQNTVRMIPADGAMYMMLDIRSTGLSGDEFADRLLDERAIAVMPGESFGASAAGHLRVALTIEDDKLVAAVEELVRFAADLQG
ncbi:MAG: pyridoxal phosphate-dependent aminotransferase [Pseudomonadota bacterium]